LARGPHYPAANPIVLRRHEDLVRAEAISPNNRRVVTDSDDGTARLWLIQINDLLDLTRITVGRNLSAAEWQLYFPGEKYRHAHLGSALRSSGSVSFMGGRAYLEGKVLTDLKIKTYYIHVIRI